MKNKFRYDIAGIGNIVTNNKQSLQKTLQNQGYNIEKIAVVKRNNDFWEGIISTTDNKKYTYKRYLNK